MSDDLDRLLVSKMTLDRAGAFAVVCIYSVLMYVESGAVPAGLHTIVLAVSLFAVLELEGKGKWTNAIRSLFGHPAKLILIAILLVSFLLQRWDGFNVSMVLDCVLGIGVFWAFEAIGSHFYKRVLAKPRANSEKQR